MLVSSDVLSLFIKVPLESTLKLVEPLFSAPVVELFRYVLRSMYFVYEGTFCKRAGGVAMGSPVLSVIADFYMEEFEKHVLDIAPSKPSLYKCYIDNSFLIWSHGRDKLIEFVTFLDTFNDNIRLTMEVENKGRLIMKKPDGILGHTIFRKATHTNLYLSNLIDHHTGQRFSVISMLIERTKKVSDEGYFKGGNGNTETSVYSERLCP